MVMEICLAQKRQRTPYRPVQRRTMPPIARSTRMNARIAPPPRPTCSPRPSCAGASVIATEASAITALRAAHRWPHFTEACRLMLACRGPRGGHRHGQVRACGAQDRRHPRLHRHAGVLRASRRSQPRRPRHDHCRGRGAGAVQLRRDRRTAVTILPLIKRLGMKLIAITGKPDSILAKPPTCTWTCSVLQRSLPAGPGAHRQHHRGAGHGRRAGDRAAGGARLHRRTISPAPIRPAAWAAACCCASSDVMHNGDDDPAGAPDATLSQALVEMTRKGLGMTAIVDAKQRAARRLHRRRPAPRPGRRGRGPARRHGGRT